MTRRNGSAAKALALSGGFMLIVFAIYSYHALSTELKKTSEKADRLRQQHDSLSAQLQVVYEHKGRLEKMLQEEQQNHQKTKDETSKQRRSTDDKYTKEKEDLLERINSITQQKNMLESRNEDLQAEYDKLQAEVQKLTDDNNQREEQNNAEFQLLKQTSANEVAQLKDQIADLQRQNNELMQQVQQAGQNNANIQNQASEAAQSVQRLQQQVTDLQNKQNAAANQNNPLLGNQAALGNQNAQFNQAGNAAVPQAGADAQNPLVGLQQQNQEHLQQAGDHGNQDAPAAMQINKPGDEKKAYFVPKAPVNEGELHVKESQGAGEGHPDEGHQQQVAPPDVGEEDKEDHRDQNLAPPAVNDQNVAAPPLALNPPDANIAEEDQQQADDNFGKDGHKEEAAKADDNFQQLNNMNAAAEENKALEAGVAVAPVAADNAGAAPIAVEQMAAPVAGGNHDNNNADLNNDLGEQQKEGEGDRRDPGAHEDVEDDEDGADGNDELDKDRLGGDGGGGKGGLMDRMADAARIHGEN